VQAIQEDTTLLVDHFPVQIPERSNSIMAYMTCCSQTTKVRVWRKTGKVCSRVRTL